MAELFLQLMASCMALICFHF